MATTEIASGFVEEIDYHELEFREVVGRGAFGMVSRAVWRGKDVAVKLIETETERKAFITELKQLSRVCHPNIVRLYGACTCTPVCLVMEYAEGGSLYNVLHGTGVPPYKAAHAMSWGLQCAKGVEYLHSMKPKPLVHRDLKPPNLLLMNGGTILKICDFGTACDAHTHMTNNKGSAAWMAPEVFEGSNYSEKCDVFSFGIILWEVLTRKKPFNEIGGPAFRIMWAVHNGTRPPLIRNCPKPLEILMTRCWHANPVERPSIFEVARIMGHLFQFFQGADQPLVYPNQDDHGTNSSVYDTPPQTNLSGNTGDFSRGTMGETIRLADTQIAGTPVHMGDPSTPKAKPVVVEDTTSNWRRSAPASLAASRESLLGNNSRSGTPTIDVVNKRYSADLSKLEEWDIAQGAKMGTAKPPGRGHRRTGSYGNSPVVTSATDLPSSPIQHSITAPGSLQQGGGDSSQSSSPLQTVAWAPEITSGGLNLNLRGNQGSLNSQNAALSIVFSLEHQLQPLAPCPSCPDSMTVYEQHCSLAQDYLRVQTETALLTQRKHELTQELKQEESELQNSNRFALEYEQLVSENESLTLLHKNLKRQVDMLKTQRPNPYQRQDGRTS